MRVVCGAGISSLGRVRRRYVAPQRGSVMRLLPLRILLPQQYVC